MAWNKWKQASSLLRILSKCIQSRLSACMLFGLLESYKWIFPTICQQDHSELSIGAAATMAHEIGHNFGMSHDHDGCCVEATAEQGGCVMAAATGWASGTHQASAQPAHTQLLSPTAWDMKNTFISWRQKQLLHINVAALRSSQM